MHTRKIQQEIQRLSPWFHNLHLPDGSQTAPQHFLGDFPRFKWEEISHVVPEDLRGWSVLDIGCNAGFYSFELARRGAHVTAIDLDDHYLEQARWASGVMGLEDRVKFRRAAIYELDPGQETYDLIWFMGVLYHLRYPLLALDLVRRLCRRHLLFQTMTCPGDQIYPVEENYDLSERQVMNQPGWPIMAFIEHRIQNDPTNWWAPNHAAVMALLRTAGFANPVRCAHETYWCEVAPLVDSCARADFESLPFAHRQPHAVASNEP